FFSFFLGSTVVSTANCRIVNYVWTEPATANAVGDRGAASPVSAPPISDHKGRSYKDSHTQ
ncbi:hypothetical protein KKE26_03665, partial [bacterium]|nr:hypothetical protein [bacterium]